MSWTIWRGDDDAVEVIRAQDGDGIGGWRTQSLNGTYPTRLDALEAAVTGASAEIAVARSRRRKLMDRLRRERRKVVAASTAE